jgi:hypothetical protein
MKSTIANPWDRDNFDYFDSPFGSIEENHSSPFEAHFNQVGSKNEDACVFNKVLLGFENEEVLELFDKKSSCSFSFKEDENMRYFDTDEQKTMAHTFGPSKIAGCYIFDDLMKNDHDEAYEQMFKFDEAKFPLKVCPDQIRFVCVYS